jgi:hypothetical protein
MSRTIGKKSQKSPNITLIGEGITEQYYFKHIRALYNYRYTLRPYFFGTTSLQDMDRKISEVIDGGGIAVCVFDVDVSERVEKEKMKLDCLLKKYNKKKSVIFCDSLPSIEYWFLLHYQNTNRFFNNSKAVEIELNSFLTNYEKKTIFLEKEKWVSDLCLDNKLETAIQRAIDFSNKGASYSNIYNAFKIFRE